MNKDEYISDFSEEVVTAGVTRRIVSKTVGSAHRLEPLHPTRATQIATDLRHFLIAMSARRSQHTTPHSEEQAYSVDPL